MDLFGCEFGNWTRVPTHHQTK